MNETRLKKLLEMEETNPADPFLKYALAQEYVSGGNDEEAERYFVLLLHSFPTYLPTYYQYALLAERSSNWELAEELYKKGIALAQQQADTKTTRELNLALLNLQFSR